MSASMKILWLAVLVAACPVTSARADDAEARASATEAARARLAPPGECARPRALDRGSDPTDFDISGPPALRFVPVQVAAGLGAGAAPLPIPSLPAPPTPRLCDHPGDCSSTRGPAFVEPEPVPSLPPGLPGARP